MFDRDLVEEILNQIITASNRITRRFEGINSSDDFLSTESGIDKLDAICMMLIAIGESVKNLDKVSNGQLLCRYPEMDWKGVMGMRDIISHHYFDLNAEIVFSICKDHMPDLINTITRMKKDL